MVIAFLGMLIFGSFVFAEGAQDGNQPMAGHHHHHGMHHEGKAPVETLNENTPVPKSETSTLIGNEEKRQNENDTRDPNAYTDGLDFSGLSKPKMGDEEYLGSVIVDRLELVSVRNEFSTTYDWQAWYGRDYDKLVVRAEGEIDGGAFRNARNESLWGHALTAFWDTQIGVRIDSGMGTGRVWGAFGVQGYAPYWIYVEATGYVGEEGRTAFRLETEYDLLITQKLILQPRIEMNFYSDADPQRSVSSGLANLEAGLRLRYEIRRELAPYIGIEWAGVFGSEAENLRLQGHQPEETRFVTGVHFWF